MYASVDASLANTGLSAKNDVGVASIPSGSALATPFEMIFLARRSASARQMRYASRGPSASPALFMAGKGAMRKNRDFVNQDEEERRTFKHRHVVLYKSLVRFSNQ